MKLCASYHGAIGEMDNIAEIRYPISHLPQALECAEKYPDKIIILEVISLKDTKTKIEKLQQVLAENKNIIIDCYKFEDLISLSKFAKVNLLMYHYPAITFNNLWLILQYHPYAVSIAEPLTFQLDKVRTLVDENTIEDEHIDIRVLPALGRPSEWQSFSEIDNGVCHFWIAPQTLETYDKYIDTLDLYDSDPEREKALIKVYATKEYIFPLGTLVKNCESIIPTAIISDEFAAKRTTCGQRCIQSKRNCHYCDMFEKTALLTRPSQSES